MVAKAKLEWMSGFREFRLFRQSGNYEVLSLAKFVL